MKAGRPPDTKLIAGATLLGLLGALASFWLLSVVAAPGHLKARTVAIERALARGQDIARRPRDTSVYLAHALCHSAPSEAADIVRGEIAAAARRSGIVPPQVTLDGPGDFQVGAEAYPVTFSIEATDRYDAVLGFLGRLADAEPQVFADTLDLTSKTSAVSLKLTGRIICQAS